MSAVRWGMLSTAGIGRMVASAVQGSADTRFVAVASRDAAKARGFAAEFGLPLSFGSYQDLLACPEVDAVYVPLPVSMHTEWTVRALNAGKHVLCEKPFAVTAADAGRCFDAAEAANRLVIEGLMWREHSQTAVAVQLVAEGDRPSGARTRGAARQRPAGRHPADQRPRRRGRPGSGLLLHQRDPVVRRPAAPGAGGPAARPGPRCAGLRPALGRDPYAAGRCHWAVRRWAGSHPTR